MIITLNGDEMAVSLSWYGAAFVSALNGEIDIANDDIRVMLTDSGYVPSQSHAYKSAVTNELVGTGYTAGGAVLGSPQVLFDPMTNQAVLSGDDVEWSPSSLTGARRAVVYDRTPATDATRPLLCWVDFGVDIGSVDNVLQILWADAGISRVTVI